jgi:hypothetical protein
MKKMGHEPIFYLFGRLCIGDVSPRVLCRKGVGEKHSWHIKQKRMKDRALGIYTKPSKRPEE